MAHPFTGSWGYQVTGYFAPTPKFGSPDDFREFVDRVHQNGIGVILDWVPGALPARRLRARPLRRHRAVRARRPAPRRAPGLGHAGLQLRPPRGAQLPRLQRPVLAARSTTPTASASTPWPRCSTSTTRARRASGCPNEYGGNEDMDAVGFLKEYNEVIHAREPGVVSAAEESTAWPGVSRPTYLGGLGFGFKWNMGWMHDTLAYFQHDPIYRRYHHHELTFSLVYAFTENFILPLSHDEVVHGKGSLVSQDAGRPLAEARQPARRCTPTCGRIPARSCCSWARSSRRRRSGARAARWTGTCSRTPSTPASSRSCATSTRPTRPSRRCGRWTSTAAGFWWTEANAADDNVIAFARRTRDSERDRAVRRQLLARGRATTTGSGCRAPAAGRGRQHRLRVLRRLGRREHGRRRRRGDRLARPALLGRGHAAAAGRALAGPRGARARGAGAEEAAKKREGEGKGEGEAAAKRAAKAERSSTAGCADDGQWTKNAASWAPSRACCGSPAPRVAVVGRFLPGAPHDHAALFWGLVAPHRRVLARLHHAADPLGARDDGRPRGRRHRAAAARRRRAVADRRRGRLHGSDARAADALRRLLLPGPLRLAAGRAGDRDLRVAARHRGRPARTCSCARTLGLRRRLRRPRGDDPVPQAPPGRRRAPPAPDGPRRPADRAREPARVRRGARPALESGPRFTLLLADVDYFKQINDRFGHTTGDRVLRELAAHASAAVRGGDCLARIGGDEFALVAPGAGSTVALRGSRADAAHGGRRAVDAGDGPRLAHRRLGGPPADGRRPAARDSCAPSTAPCTRAPDATRAPLRDQTKDAQA